jgi:AcrR family transcriptional regulator
MGVLERKEREKEARRSQILDAAEIIFEAKGLSQATMDDIAKEAELAKGTIYLYYKNKDELQVGLIMRSFDMMNASFTDAFERAPLAIQKITEVGKSYWDFAASRPFNFGMMCNMDFPQRALISDELFAELDQKSSWLWKFLVAMIDEAKHEGTIKHDVDSFSLSMLLWINSMSILRLYQRLKLTPGNIVAAKNEFNMANLDFPKLYDFALTSALTHVVTSEGAKYIAQLRFPSMSELGVIADLRQHQGTAPSLLTNQLLSEETII